MTEESRNRQRHQVLSPIFFMVTEDALALNASQHHIEGEVTDLSETGFRMRSTHLLEKNEEISFDITNDAKTLFHGVAKVIHCLPENVYGVRYIKVKQGN
jgi:hypothetical protein